MKYEAAVPITVERRWNRQLKKAKITSPASEHAGPLDISILLDFMTYVAGEKHRQQVFKGYPPGDNIASNDYCKKATRISSRRATETKISFAIDNNYRI